LHWNCSGQDRNMTERKSQLLFEIAPQEENLQALETFEDEFSEHNGERILVVLLYRWLWAARLYKTRPLARAAIEQGKILYNGQKALPSKEIELGATISIAHGRSRKSIVVKGLSTRRRNLDEGQALYEEVESIYTQSAPAVPYESPDEYFNSNDHSVKGRKAVRYLRRNMNIGDSSSAYKGYESKD
jgi:ribosomal 50S subunit-recycling heat shock protein